MPSSWEIALLGSSLLSALYFLLFRAGFHKYTKASQKESESKVSVIIAAHNELPNLQILIPSLLKQNHKQFEIIIANDRSTDGSHEYLSAVKDSRLKVVEISDCPRNHNPKKNALTLAIHEATNPILLLTDADCLPCSDRWITEMTNPYNNETDFVIGYGGYKRYAGFLNLFIRFETLFTLIQYAGLGLLRRPYMAVGRNLSYRKAIFTEANGFDQLMSITGGDDDLFVNRNATSRRSAFVLEPSAQTISEPERDWKSYFRQKWRRINMQTNSSRQIILFLIL